MNQAVGQNNEFNRQGFFHHRTCIQIDDRQVNRYTEKIVSDCDIKKINQEYIIELRRG